LPATKRPAVKRYFPYRGENDSNFPLRFSQTTDTAAAAVRVDGWVGGRVRNGGTEKKRVSSIYKVARLRVEPYRRFRNSRGHYYYNDLRPSYRVYLYTYKSEPRVTFIYIRNMAGDCGENPIIIVFRDYITPNQDRTLAGILWRHDGDYVL